MSVKIDGNRRERQEMTDGTRGNGGALDLELNWNQIGTRLKLD